MSLGSVLTKCSPWAFAPPLILRPWAWTSRGPSSARERPPPRGLFLLPTAALDGPRRYRRRPRSSPMTLPDPTALFGTKIVCRNLGRSCKSASRQLARKGSPPPAPTSGEVVTKFQSDSSRTDSPVRILYAQPTSAVSAVSTAHVEEPAIFRFAQRPPSLACVYGCRSVTHAINPTRVKPMQ